MIREFSLKNAIGNTWNLNDLASFFTEPDGLGFEYDVDYQQIGNIFIKLQDDMKQKEPSGQIKFSTYEKYREFCLFIQHKPLVMEYTTPSGNFFMDVSIDKLEKSELETGGLFCDIKLLGLSTFYKIVRAENDGSMVAGKIYPYSYNYRYSDYSQGAVEFDCDSVLESAVKLTILGPCTNPSWTNYLNGVVASVGKVNCTIKDGNRLIVDNTKIPFEIAEYDSTGTFVQNLYQNSDFSTDRFVTLGFGSNKISFAHEGENAISLIAEGKIIYESV